MNVLPLFFGRTKLPVNVAPAWSRIVSPGSALLSAACRSPPELTVMVAALAADPRLATSADASRTLAVRFISIRKKLRESRREDDGWRPTREPHRTTSFLSIQTEQREN